MRVFTFRIFPPPRIREQTITVHQNEPRTLESPYLNHIPCVRKLRQMRWHHSPRKLTRCFSRSMLIVPSAALVVDWDVIRSRATRHGSGWDAKVVTGSGSEGSIIVQFDDTLAGRQSTLQLHDVCNHHTINFYKQRRPVILIRI